ncbi:AP2 domain-containing protein [Escherichia coli]|nr:AP2 domain-containing protein [Escherichia coli]
MGRNDLLIRTFPKYGKWRARINASGKCINLGYHDTAELAAAAFEAARMKYHTV